MSEPMCYVTHHDPKGPISSSCAGGPSESNHGNEGKSHDPTV